MPTPKEHLARIDGVLRKAHHRYFQGAPLASNGELVDWRNPLDELIAAEERAEAEMAEDLREESARAQLAALEAFSEYENLLIDWIFADGPHPLRVMRRIYAYAKMKRATLLWNMSFRDLGMIFNESHAAAAHQCKVLFGDTPAGWRKQHTARLNMAAAQQGNCNRRGGKKLWKKSKRTRKAKGSSETLIENNP